MKKSIERLESRIQRLLDTDVLFAFGFVLLALFWCWRLPLGMANADETFYLSVPLRLLKGDHLLTDEWHVAQLSGFLLTPFLALFKLVRGDMEGVALAFRAFWLAMHLCVTALSYALLRPRSKPAAAAASLGYGLFCPFGIMALSYNTMGMAAVYLLVVLLFMGYHSRLANIAKGFLLAISVLCNPYCLLLYAALLVCALLNRHLRFDDQLGMKDLLWMHAGILILFIPFAVHVISGMESFEHLLESLSLIVQDPEHPPHGFFAYSIETIRQIICDRPKFFAVYAALLIAGFPIRRLRPFALAGIALWCGYSALWDARWMTYSWGMNSTALYYGFTALAVFLYDEERRVREGVYALLLPFLYMLCMNMASNQQFHVMACAAISATCLTVPMLVRYAKRHSFAVFGWHIPYMHLVALMVAVVQLAASGYVRSHYYFWEYPKDNPLTERIEAGPLKGVVTRPENREKYEEFYQAVTELGDIRDKQVMFYSCIPTGYLIADCRMGAPSAWTPYFTLRKERLLAYYELNPHKLPDMIFVDRTTHTVWQMEDFESYAADYGYVISRFDERFAVLERAQ